MKKEYWKPVVGYEGLYMVSNWGRVKSIKFGKEKILKQSKDKKTGYLHVGLCKENILKHFLVHRLVAEAFIDNSDNLPQVNHKDENKTNNNVDNLEWCTNEYNINYGTRTERYSKPVLQYTLDGVFVREWKSIAEAGRNGYQQICISKCCRGLNKQHKGFIWKYKEDK